MSDDNWESWRNSIIGLSSGSGKKSYYPELQDKMLDLERFKTLIDASGEIIILAERDTGLINYCNFTAASILEYEKDELKQLKIQNITTHENNTNCLHEAEKNNGLQMRCFFKKKSLDYLPVEVGIKIVNFDNVDYIVIIAKDITERLKAEKQIIDSENKFHAVFNNFFQQTGIIALDGTLLDINKTVINFTNKDYDDIIGTKLWDAPWLSHSPKEQKKILEAVKEASTGKSIAFETTHINGDGNVRYIDFSIKPVFDEYDQVSYLLSEGRDITAKKNTELELIGVKKLLDDILESMPSGVIALGEDFNVIHINSFALNILNKQENDVIGKPFFRIISPSLSETMESIVYAMNKNEKTISKIITEKDFDNIERSYEYTFYKLNKNFISGIVIRIDDVTEKLKLNEILVQSEKMLTVGGLAAGMAHEINNPLGIVINGIQNTLRRISIDLPENIKEAERDGISLEAMNKYLENRKILTYLNGISEAAMRASQIVYDMLTFSKKSDKTKTLFDINNTVEKTLQIMNGDHNLYEFIKTNNIEVIKDFGKSIEIPININEIEQVLINIIRNGIEAFVVNNEINKKFYVKLSTKLTENTMNIYIENNGPAISENTRKRLFEPFFTTKDPGKGTGLGLSISYFIIHDRHNGEITVESDETRTLFTIKLPVK